MKSLEFISVPRSLPPEWNRKFALSGAHGVLGESLLRRWTKNADWIPPSAAFSGESDVVTIPWSELLGYVFAHGTCSGSARANVVEAYRIAMAEFGPALAKGTVWLEDLLALRHLQYNVAESKVFLEAMGLLLAGLEQIPGHFPGKNFEQYQLFHDIYEMATMCLVSELYEPKLIDASFVAGTRLLPADSATLFVHMQRLADEAAKREYRDPRSPELEAWSAHEEHKQSIVDRLFDTLSELNPRMLDSGEMASTAILSHARELDLAWFRLAHVCSDTEAGKRAAKAVKRVRAGAEALYAVDNTELGRRQPYADREFVRISVPQGRYQIRLGPKADEIIREREQEDA